MGWGGGDDGRGGGGVGVGGGGVGKNIFSKGLNLGLKSIFSLIFQNYKNLL